MLFELFLLYGLTMNYVGIIKKTREKIISLFPVHKFENITFDFRTAKFVYSGSALTFMFDDEVK